MKRYKIIKQICCLILGTVCIVSCKKFINIAPPKTEVASATVFESDATATSAVVGLYAQMSAYNLTFLNGAMTIYPGLSADELNDPTSNSDDDEFKNNAISSNSYVISSTIWKNAYSYIYQTNAVLEGLHQSGSVSSPVRAQLSGEMLFTRALNNFYLTNLFGDVPLIDSTDYTINSSIPRIASAKVYEQIIADLSQAQTLLTGSFSSSVNTRPSEMAAAALLSRVYLYQKQWVNAEAEATTVINSGDYHLEPDLNNVFLNTSTETIFQLMRPFSNTAEGYTFIPYDNSSLPLFTVTTSLLNAFEQGDQRKTDWLDSNVVNNQAFYYPFKYKSNSYDNITEDEVVLRLAEVYLIRAEARAEQNNINGALADLNLIRNRAGLPNSTAANATDLLTAIQRERRIELFAEWGHRWLDLKRTGTANQILGTYKGSAWQATDVLYPIPFDQIQRNHFLTQNPGYN